jgi:uncharacterized Zn-binding protein involved in type VI secretion
MGIGGVDSGVLAGERSPVRTVIVRSPSACNGGTASTEGGRLECDSLGRSKTAPAVSWTIRVRGTEAWRLGDSCGEQASMSSNRLPVFSTDEINVAPTSAIVFFPSRNCFSFVSYVWKGRTMDRTRFH